MALEYQIKGGGLPYLEIFLKPGDTVYSETGAMSWMSSNVEMKTRSGGGLGKMFKRALGGESLFITDFRLKDGDRGLLAFASEFPGTIVAMELKDGETIIAQKDAFMCAEKSVDLDIFFQKKLGAGFFGGEGFIMEKLTGPGLVFFELDGDIVEHELAKGEELLVDTGHVALLESSVSFSVKMMKGFKNILFGGEGLFLATLKGPGKVWLQSMPMKNLALKIVQYLPRTKGGGGGSGISFGTFFGDD
jgi:uncharacterized protein (TIGR00266 family)